MLWITGAAGFIGSCFARQMAAQGERLCLVDKLEYASHMAAIEPILSDDIVFHKLDIGDNQSIAKLLQTTACRGVVNFAAESHVDRSIDAPELFASNNVLGTVRLLQEVQLYWHGLSTSDQSQFRFLQISTDEVFGALGATGCFDENSRYAPNSPYAASKAAADHFVRAYHQTYGLPILTVHSSNNFGPWQHEEKLIPKVICNASQSQTIPIYGSGNQVRDWIFVEENCKAIATVLRAGKVGESYCVGGGNEVTNLELAQLICEIIAEKQGKNTEQLKQLIQHVDDRPGHDFRYAIDSSKLRALGISQNEVSFESQLRTTIDWYLRRKT